jgi:hypothetical protein
VGLVYPNGRFKPKLGRYWSGLPAEFAEFVDPWDCTKDADSGSDGLSQALPPPLGMKHKRQFAIKEAPRPRTLPHAPSSARPAPMQKWAAVAGNDTPSGDWARDYETETRLCAG